MKSYIICAVPRSGSWLLSDLLEQTELAGRPDEYFRPDYRVQWASDWGIAPTGPYGRFVREALDRTSTANGVFGVKMHWYQFEWLAKQLREIPGASPDAPAEVLVRRWLPDVHYVHLHRDDTIRQAISYYRASYSDRWFHLTGEETGEAETRYIRPVPRPEQTNWGHVKFLENLVIEHDRKWSDFFASTGIEPLEVRYEDLNGDYEGTVRRVLGFLEIPAPAEMTFPPPRLKKQADEETELLAEEYRAVRDTVTPEPINMFAVRRTILPQAFNGSQGSPADQVTS